MGILGGDLYYLRLITVAELPQAYLLKTNAINVQILNKKKTVIFKRI